MLIVVQLFRRQQKGHGYRLVPGAMRKFCPMHSETCVSAAITRAFWIGVLDFLSLLQLHFLTSACICTVILCKNRKGRVVSCVAAFEKWYSVWCLPFLYKQRQHPLQKWTSRDRWEAGVGRRGGVRWNSAVNEICQGLQKLSLVFNFYRITCI